METAKIKKYELNKNQIIMWQKAYDFNKIGKVLCLGYMPKTKEGKEFLKPFVQAEYVCKDSLKYCGVFKLTQKGIQKFEEILNTLNT